MGSIIFTTATADTLTEGMIRDLQSEATLLGNHGIARYASIALNEITQSPRVKHITVQEAREILALEWNTRTMFAFSSSSNAWAFMRECDDAGIAAGYPSLTAPYTVRINRNPE